MNPPPKNKHIFPTFLSVLNINHSDENIYEEIDQNLLARLNANLKHNDAKKLSSNNDVNQIKTDLFVENFNNSQKQIIGLRKKSQKTNHATKFISSLKTNKTRRLIFIATTLVVVLVLILAIVLIVIGVSSISLT